MNALTGTNVAVEEKRLLDRLVVSCIQELFAAYGVTLQETEWVGETGDSAEFTYMGLIGFSGGSIRGTLLLAPSTLSVAETPWRTREELRDWVGELANQLLGRIKNKLLRYGIEIYLTIPITIRGKHLAPVSRMELRPYSFDAGPGCVAVWMDIEVADEFELTLQESTSEDRIVEGDAILF